MYLLVGWRNEDDNGAHPYEPSGGSWTGEGPGEHTQRLSCVHPAPQSRGRLLPPHRHSYVHLLNLCNTYHADKDKRAQDQTLVSTNDHIASMLKLQERMLPLLLEKKDIEDFLFQTHQDLLPWRVYGFTTLMRNKFTRYILERCKEVKFPDFPIAFSSMQNAPGMSIR